MVEIFCETPNIENFSSLSEDEKEIVVDTSFKCLFQKFGKLDMVAEVLGGIDLINEICGYLIYTGEIITNNKLKNFIKTGVATIPIFEEQEIPFLQEQFDETLLSFPEYSRHPDNPSLNQSGNEITYVLGGFGAFGNPASFHNNFARKVRMKYYKKVKPFFSDLINSYYNEDMRNNYKIEILFDRMMFRKRGQVAMAEAWHRDVIPKDLILPKDEVFGGWINLGTKDQYFSCIPGSHLGIDLRSIPSGFDTMSKREEANIRKEYKDKLKNMTTVNAKKFINKMVKERISEVSKKKYRFRVPPGHCIIFPQYILHEVVATAVKHDMRRLFTGVRMTVGEKPLINIDEIIKNQAVPPLPGGMIPPMYSSNHSSCYLGIPTVSKTVKNGWELTLAEKYIKLYPTDRMKKLYKKLQQTSDSDGIKLIKKMTKEYMNEANLEDINIEKNPTSLSIGTFKLVPDDNESISTLIKWSGETMKPQTMIIKNYKKSMGKYSVLDRHMKSLKHYNFDLYSEYSDDEKIIYTPHKIN